MFLKRIELAGFKSFADKTELEFVQGITAVVGPNGSGKSNISDGIRWVLGEQSAKSLRGGKMEDIIFAGSDARKAVNYSEVSLTLDNTDHALHLDFSEVTVTRRVHRSGESEYFINKQACRLKDITELFMDTGIGKEAYSIIGQGRIEEILSTRSEDRRGIFEEASGIVKYKSRKREAQKKLEETEQNLLRIHDLVTELEDQIEPLREQSGKAQQYKQLKEQLKTSEIAVYVHQIDELHRHWQEAGSRLEALKQEQLGLSTTVSQHDAHLEKHRLTVKQLEEQLEQLQASLLQLSEEFEKSEGYGEVLKERKKNLEQNYIQQQSSSEQQHRRIIERETELSTYKEKQAALQEQLQQLELEQAAEEQRLMGVASGIGSEPEEQLKAELLDTLNRTAQTRNEMRYVDQQIEQLSKRSERLEEDKSKWLQKKEQTREHRDRMQQQLAQTSEEIEAARNEYIAANLTMKEQQELLEDVQQTLRKWEQKRDALVSRRDTIKELQNDFDGFMHGVREVLKARKRGDLHGIQGAVAELVKVPVKVETAIETALGGALQHIVMQDEAASRAAIAFLKKRQLGRATFLPLDVIRGRSVSDGDLRAAQSAEGFVGIAVDLIEFEAPYAQVMASLLGNVLISESLEQANRIAAKIGYRYRVVTLEGDVVNAGGSMTGGSANRKSSSLLGRQREIDQLTASVAQSEQQLEQLKHKVADIKKAIADVYQRLETLRELGEKKRIDEQQLLSELHQVEAEEKQLEAQLKLYEQDRGDQDKERLDHDEKLVELKTSLEQLEEEQARLQEEIRLAESKRKAGESEKEKLQGKLTELKVKAAGLYQEKQSLEDQIQRFTSDLQLAAQERDATLRLIRQSEQDLQFNESETVRQIEQVNDLQIRKTGCAEQIELKRAERADWQRQLEHGENETREQRNRLKQVEEHMHQVEVRANRLDVELDNQLKKLGEEYEISYEWAKERFPVPEDIAGEQNKVRELKKQIAQLGDVNLGAIEEFQRVGERFDFLSKQKEDLIEAKTTLYHVIREMDEEMSRRFSVTFEAIRQHFVIVFSKLFGGGRADLVLSEPNNMLETGVDIVAQPPGKKLQNLQLLSGGERALTAIALLFAILRVKPVPFCVLDEVEAALDDANVSRFAEYLREFSNDTQFIVVTHRKGTMEEADVLYGVTMEEGGVSKLVSVRLEEDEEMTGMVG